MKRVAPGFLALCLFLVLSHACFAEDKPGAKAGAAPAAATPAATTPAPSQPAPQVAPGGTLKAAEVDSLPILEKLVARDSSKVDNLFRLGVLYLDRDRPAEAARVLMRAARSRPNDLRILVNLGAAMDAAGNALDAQGYYRKALAVSPGDSIASCRLASSLYAAGKHQESVDLLRGVIQKKPGSYCAYFTLGVAFADAGIYRDAIRMWKKVVELAPGSPEAVSAQESIDVLQKLVQ